MIEAWKFIPVPESREDNVIWYTRPYWSKTHRKWGTFHHKFGFVFYTV